MTSKLRVLGLALMALFAFGAIAATGASAEEETTGVLTAPEAVTLIGEETGGAGANALTAFGGKTECPGSIITGHEIESTPHVAIPSGSKEVTLTPHYNQEECHTIDANENTFSTTVDMNGCDYEGTVGETTEGATEDAYGFDVQINCPAGEHIRVTLFAGSAHSLRLCTMTVTNTTITSDAHVGNDTSASPHDLWVAGKFTGIIVHKSGLCGAGTDEEGSFHIDATVKGYNEVETQIPVTITH